MTLSFDLIALENGKYTGGWIITPSPFSEKVRTASPSAATTPGVVNMGIPFVFQLCLRAIHESTASR